MRADEVVVSRPRRDAAGVARFLTGSLAAGLVALTAVLVVAEWVTEANGLDGPGAGTITGHAVASFAALVAAVVADRQRGRIVAAALAVVVAVVAAVLWFYWLT
ncbi:hypothetical protein [Thermocrispum agreste]|jgi:hypothetical protein|uniref:Uncharacterized protein n=1 Tax=Thermocrispum agreste TaxID=37925 RepID=A0A2W4K1G3_9PSEU|nr:hypothetical protein [Thermocrispum agreste]PZN00018.1 MAG: hypothetical protein DIU77_04510 [Thermocrispum agreste]